MRISLGSDHGGFQLKEELVLRLERAGMDVMDRGCSGGETVDYPDVASSVCSDLPGAADLGILVCGTGIGMCNTASRFDHIIAALCTNEYMARMAREHNAANVLCLGGRVIGPELAWAIVRTFITSEPLSDDRYIRRRKKVRMTGPSDADALKGGGN
ncbi:MAG: ribose 5-phosphate isomerase B [Candidatus Thermoplasmatota archaeon]|nr:ribose 5-phosphate isomerase B [Candidatus Thermoplasmatota archaeon]